MRVRSRFWVVLVAVASCRETAPPVVQRPVPASIVAVTTPTATVTVGYSAGTVGVKVLDADGDPVSGAVVSFAISKGAGQLGATSVRSGADGTASSTYRAGATAGLNEVTASVAGVAALKFSVVGAAGAPRAITFSQRSLKYTLAVDSLFATAIARDSFLNASSTAITWIARNPALISVTPTGGGGAAVKVSSRPGSTYLVATSGAASDSLFVTVPDSASTPCTFFASPVQIALGGTQQFDGGSVCVRSIVAGAEYVVVAHLGTSAYGVSQQMDVTGDGITPPLAPFPEPPQSAAPPASQATALRRDFAFERRIRSREAAEIGPRVASARAAIASSNFSAGAATSIVPTGPRVGDLVSLNVNADDFCDSPDLHQARVAAISKTAVLVADVENPSGGFTDAEFQSIGAEMDTLVLPVDTAAFGSPSDIDRNGHVTIFFTRAVNALTLPGSPGGVVLGFYYLRDLLPRKSAYGECPGSNVGEVLYVLVPDVTGAVNSNIRSKAFVASSIVATIGHEFQHLINASRRMYVNDAQRVDEEVWLNEGLSHIAEELLFYRASGLSPRANIGAGQLAPGTVARAAFDNYQDSNIGRYDQYLVSPESNSPMADYDFLATRGATWSYLRYLVDRVRTSDGDFWRKLVNSRWTGTVNLDSALTGSGVTAVGAMRDWSTAVLMDGIAPGATFALQQLSWNFVSVFSGIGMPFVLSSRVLTNGVTTAVGIVGGGTSYLRFGVAQNREGLIRVTARGGDPLPAGMRLTIARIR